ncbi:4-hydroxybenzoyl-CoA thioesterase family active site [Prochlorococcus marinus str. MIT 9515]|uniref:4-hydroxybenzoyl-CoA thioesterase family active site n=1 Tax=Prochlorococcus marinus (strain MIT 9515) TaxID=167542 RepID=A2BWZ3_PROM5|nr:acyl-CoA thioesterase [Prochlorococcus marinus]ABM72304.1 4-hydroxybenzoyl-CoA thioesterase family active site [Prochlorococcus marinus str. MIT 9515]
MKKIWKINKVVLPQHSDHAGVMWHGTYFNWLEEGRIDALSKAGINYVDLTNYGFEMPLIETSVKYIKPLLLGEKITIETQFNISKSPKIKIYSKFVNESKNVLTKAEVTLTLINKNNFSIIRNRPDFISNAFLELNG